MQASMVLIRIVTNIKRNCASTVSYINCTKLRMGRLEACMGLQVYILEHLNIEDMPDVVSLLI